jgi:hypothetical protein
MQKQLMALVLLGLAGVPVFGGQIFVDHFDYTSGLQQTSFGDWIVTSGGVDVLGAGSGDAWLCQAAGCIDTDGTSWTGQPTAATFKKEFAALAAGTYVISFRLGGSRRGDSNTIQVSFGGVTHSYTLGASDAHGVRSFIVNWAGGNTSLQFSHKSSSDNKGLILDDVSVATGEIPEPGTWTMIAAGAALLLLRRRR